MLFFQLMYLGFDIGGGICRHHLNRCLKDRLPFVALFAHIVDSYASLLLSGRHYRLMDMTAIHTFAPIFRKQGRMYVDYTPGISGYQKRRNHKQEPRKHYKVNPTSGKQRKHYIGIAYVGTREDDGLYSQPLRPPYHRGISLVSDDDGDFGPAGVRLKIAYDVLGIRTIAGSKDSNPFHFFIRVIMFDGFGSVKLDIFREIKNTLTI